MRPVNRVYISSGSYRFGVELPGGYRVDNLAADQLTMVSKDLSSALGFRVAGKVSDEAKALKPEFYRDLVLEQYPGAKITEEFMMPAACAIGPAFDLQLPGMKGVARSARVTFVPTEAGILQFSITGSAEKVKVSLADFHTLVLTFRASDRNGKLEMPSLPIRI